LTKATIKLLKDEKLRDEMGMKRVRGTSWDDVAKRVAKVLFISK